MELLKELNIYNPHIFGKGIKKPILWSNLLANELHKPITKKFRKRRVYVNGIDETWAADLVDMNAYSKQNKGVKYLLTVIDIFSKYGWIIPLKNKSGLSVAEAFNKIFHGREGRKPIFLWVDKGKEFYNKTVKDLFKGNSIEMYSTENEEKSSVVERWNGTMKQRMFKYFTANNIQKYYNVLDELVDDYNNTYHSSIKMTPVEASKLENERKVYENLFPKEEEIIIKPVFKIGDRVRITKKKKFFEKGYTPKWTEEIFVIDQILNTNPITYKIKDLQGEEIIGSFYNQKLQKSRF